MKTLAALLLLSISLNFGLASGWVRIGDPAESGYTEAQREQMDTLVKSLEE